MTNARVASSLLAVLLGCAAFAGSPARAGSIVSTATIDFTLTFPTFDNLVVTHTQSFAGVIQRPPTIASVTGAWTFGQNAAGTELVYKLAGMQETVKVADLADPVEVQNGITAYLDVVLANFSSTQRVVTFTATWKPSLSIVGQGVSVEDEPRPFATSVVQADKGRFDDKSLLVLFDRRIALGDDPLIAGGSKSFDIAVGGNGGSVTVPLRISAFANAGARVPEPSSLGLVIACLCAAVGPVAAARFRYRERTTAELRSGWAAKS